MLTTGNHPGDELQQLLDGRLEAERRAQVEAHLAVCARCRRELAALRWVTAAVRKGLPERDVPAAVAAGVAAALDGADRAARRRRPAWVIGLALAAAAVLVVLVTRGGAPDVVAAAAEELARYRAADLPLQLETGDPRALERLIARSTLRFPVRVFDFGMMGYRLAGGGAHRLAGRRSALFAYEDAGGRRVVCQMYEGRITELPAGAERREHDGIQFRIYRTAGLTLVFWQEGDVVCVLASDGDPEEAVQLAYAKAIKE
ncbi:MAG: zf-HC2 domain-containing protein [Gemmatimonadetes bacterium]|nr:zf-HC2 domain-containing protein [Gemmatimonadota bacterium]